jgi:trehalose 6-phosphate synthase/phosphatase
MSFPKELVIILVIFSLNDQKSVQMAKTIIISNRLPIRIAEEDGQLAYKQSEGGLATGLGSIFKEGDNLWVGWPGLPVSKTAVKKEITTRLKEEHMVPVFLTAQEVEDYYEGFSNETLWPNFHYFNQYSTFDEDTWKAYQRVNKKFADKVNELAEDGDTIWIHDYQLLLLPGLIREKKPNASIGFFLHIPFPSYESFRLLPYRRELLMGMLGADFLGFHTYDDMRHFLSSVNRLAGFGNENGKITIENRIIRADSLPMGIDYDKYAQSAASPDTLEREVRYRTSMGDVDLILSIDRLDYSKGIPQRLRAFEKFLEGYPDFLGKVSILMVVVPSRDKVPKYRQLKEEIELLVGRINGRFGRINWMPIHYFYRSFPLAALSAFYRMSKVALVTPMRDGMNLVCKEYIASRLDQKGVLILSEMAGASKELSDAIVINPNDIRQMVCAIHEALTMSEEEQKKHMHIMQDSLRRYNIHAWVKLFMEQLQNVKEEQKALQTKVMDEDIINHCLKDFQKASKKAIFLDYDGTLVPFTKDPQHATPGNTLRKLLSKLAALPDTHVVIITGRDKETIGEWMKNLPVDIVAEHGMWMKLNGQDFEPTVNLSNAWKKEIRETLDWYVDRTPGSFVEEKGHSLVWHYRKVETGLGEVRTRELTSHLKYLTNNKNLQVMEGNKVLEIKSSEVNKGKGAMKIVDHHQPDFIMACGDDWTDEDTFRELPDSAHTIKVGGGASEAKYSLHGPEEVLDLLKRFTES